MSYDFSGKRVFVSGPMTGIAAWNKPAFDEAADWLRFQGASEVYNPASHAPKHSKATVYPHECYMRLTLSNLTTWTWELEGGVPTPKSWYDAIALLPGWERSEGAKVERLVAEAIGLDVVELGDAL